MRIVLCPSGVTRQRQVAVGRVDREASSFSPASSFSFPPSSSPFPPSPPRPPALSSLGATPVSAIAASYSAAVSSSPAIPMNSTRSAPSSEEEEEQEGEDLGVESSLRSSSATPRATLLAEPPGDLLVEAGGRDESSRSIPGASIGRHPPGSGIEAGKESTCAMTSMTWEKELFFFFFRSGGEGSERERKKKRMARHLHRSTSNRQCFIFPLSILCSLISLQIQHGSLLTGSPMLMKVRGGAMIF